EATAGPLYGDSMTVMHRDTAKTESAAFESIYYVAPGGAPSSGTDISLKARAVGDASGDLVIDLNALTSMSEKLDVSFTDVYYSDSHSHLEVRGEGGTLRISRPPIEDVPCEVAEPTSLPPFVVAALGLSAPAPGETVLTQYAVEVTVS